MKIYMSTNSSVNFKHENSFLKLLLKTAKIRHFWYQILFKKTQISLFFPKFKKFYFSTLTNLRTLISNELIIFQNYSPKVPKKAFLKKHFWKCRKRHFWYQTWRFFVLDEFSHFDIFEGADFKYDNSIFQISVKITEIRYFWCQI